MKKTFFLTLIVAVMVAWMPAGMAQKLDTKIGQDPNVRVGKLDNGLTYYVRHNDKPAGRVEFRLAVNAGSCQEDDDQQGLAHFTEHMAFNGITGYPHNTMISELQKIGVIFGQDINAYTSFDETVFMITMPCDDKKYVDMGIDFLYGWACGLLYDPKEIDDERGVVSEEYRMGRGADDRMRQKWFPVVFNNSQYAKRLPIGLIEIIQNFKPEVIRRFYNDWYRTDLQAVIVVGDIDADAIEQQIKEKFSPIPAKQNPREKVYPTIADNKEPLVCVATDKEAGGSQIMMGHKFPHHTMVTVQDFKDHMAAELYNSMYASRMMELMQDPNCPAVSMGAGYSHFIGQIDGYFMNGMAKEGRILDAIRVMLREDYRVLKHGFLETELQRAKDALMEEYERAVKELDKTESAKFANEYVDNFLYGTPIPGAKRELNYAKKYLEEITLEDVNALAKKWIVNDNFLAVVMAPEKEGVKVPSEAEVLAVINDKSLADVEPYVDNYKEQEIIEKETLKPGFVTSKRDLPEVGATEYTLSNGIKVVAKQTDFKNDEILFSAVSPGGMSMYYECDIPSLSLAADMVDRGGINEMDNTTLHKKLKGKKISLTPNISPIREGLSGSTSPKDLDLFFQYINAFFTHPRHDTTAYSLVMNEVREQLKMIKAQPMYKFIGEFMNGIYDNDPYMSNMLTFTDETLDKVDYERAFYLYQERFANPADFTFFFTGSFDEQELVSLMETYLASMPTTDQMEKFRPEVFKKGAEGIRTKNIYSGADDAASWVGLAFVQPLEWNEANELMVEVVNEAVTIECLEIIREKMGGVYSPMVQMALSKYPRSNFMSMVMFSCAPKNVDKLANAVIKIMEKFCKKGPKPETLAKVKEQMLRTAESDQQTNHYWHNYIATQYFNGDDLNEMFTMKENLEKITVSGIANFMQKNFKTDQYLRVNMYPESWKDGGKKSKK
ncbi:MAG: insulinase family protein [Bacteroidales bacterium]|nr:insulinase family protein [Bacteroidales bacterium]